MTCNVNPDYWTRTFKFVTKDSEIPDSDRVPMSQWGFPKDAKAGNQGHGKEPIRRKRNVQSAD